jgi:hypothetical protein
MPQQPPPDDPQIGNEDFLLRRVRGDQISLGANGGYRVSSAVFKSKGGPLSFDLGSRKTAEAVRDQYQGKNFHVVSVPVGNVRAQGCRVVLEPEENNDAHVHVYGSGAAGCLSGGQASRIADVSQVILLHPDLPIPNN